MTAPTATAAAKSIAVHCARVRRGARRNASTATAYIIAAFAAASATVPASVVSQDTRTCCPRGRFGNIGENGVVDRLTGSPERRWDRPRAAGGLGHVRDRVQLRRLLPAREPCPSA